ncbi:Hsp20/alpha crystallin family protein [Desulfobulbus rhabdoformis]|uniref:Hsp20/alpha crystallin family protein n=1 Tax=Desulfobulbus rhabdoformis TaxID=34032 RepID=UPI00196483FE|nr:Hsp20/alpha crystallin family protein [Desulfobulbus rhabdoformis]MBM9616600.1 Hsp20/alpha crystallin family protein [Desulfobulbus rhabdoformis]
MFTHLHDMHQFLGAMDLFRNRMNTIFNDFDRTASPAYNWVGTEVHPPTNLSDSGDNLEIVAEVPGVKKEDLEVKIQGNYLQITGTRKNAPPEGYKTHRTERTRGSFSRSFTLPYDVDASKAEATLTHGLLRLVLPKAETAKPKQITIQ